jgi:hypothetical protein
MATKVLINLAADEVLVPEGTYLVEVAGIDARVSQSKDVYLSWRLIVAEGKHEGAALFMVSSLRSDLLRLLRSAFSAIGVDVDSGEVALEWEGAYHHPKDRATWSSPLTSPDVVGRQAYAVVIHDEWEGETRAKVRRLIKAKEE